MFSGIYIKGSALCHKDSVTSVSPDVSLIAMLDWGVNGWWVSQGCSPEGTKKVPPYFSAWLMYESGPPGREWENWQFYKVALQWKALGESWVRVKKMWLRATKQVIRVYDFGPRQCPFFSKSTGCFFLKGALDRKIGQTHYANQP